MILLFALACHPRPRTEPELQQRIRELVAHEAQVSPERVTVEPARKQLVPGVRLYRVDTDRQAFPGPGALAVDGRIVLDPDEQRTVIARAWHYGEQRTVPPSDLAYALLITADSRGDASVLDTEEDVTIARRLGVHGVTTPQETTEGGLPGLRFWYGNGENPATEVIAVFHPDGKVDLDFGRTMGGG